MWRLALLVAATMVPLAANSVLNRLALTGTETGPSSFATLRIASGAGMLCAIVLIRGGWPRLRQAIHWQNALALFVYMLGFSFAYVSLDAGLGALILFGGVQVTMFLGAVLASEAIPKQRWLGAAVAFCGLVYLLWPAGAGAPAPMGALLMTAAAVGWGVYSLLGRRSDDPMAVTAASFLLALIPAALITGLFPDPISWNGAWLAILSGAITSGLAYALWYALLPHLPATVAAVAQLTVPVLAMAGGAVFLGEAVGWRFVISALLVVTGVLLSLQWRQGR